MNLDRIFNYYNLPLFIIQPKKDMWEEYNMYKQCQLIIELAFLTHNHCPPLFSIPLFALLYLSTFSIPWLEAEMDPVEEEHQARRAKKQAQWYLPNITPAPVLNREKGRGKGKWQSKFYLTSIYVPQNLEDAILDLHRHQLAQQQQRTTQGHRKVKVERQRQVEINQIIEN